MAAGRGRGLLTTHLPFLTASKGGIRPVLVSLAAASLLLGACTARDPPPGRGLADFLKPNLGPGPASDVSWSDPIPDALNVVSGDFWGENISLASGSSVSFTYVATPITNMSQRSPIRRVGNSAILDPYPGDPNPSNDESSVVVKIIGRV